MARPTREKRFRATRGCRLKHPSSNGGYYDRIKVARCPCGAAFPVPSVAPPTPPPLPAAEKWYYGRGGQQFGPVPRDFLRQLAQVGQLSPSDLVWKEGMAQWTPAKDIAGLLPDALPVSAPSEPGISAVPAPFSEPQGIPNKALALARGVWARRRLRNGIGAFCLGVVLAWAWASANAIGIAIGVVVLALVVGLIFGLTRERKDEPSPVLPQPVDPAGLAPSPAYVAAMLRKREEERRDAGRGSATGGGHMAFNLGVGCLAIAALIVWLAVSGTISLPSGSQQHTGSQQSAAKPAEKQVDRAGAARLEEMVHKLKRSEAESCMTRSQIRAVCYIILGHSRPQETFGDLLLVADRCPLTVASMTFDIQPPDERLRDIVLAGKPFDHLPTAEQDSLHDVWGSYQKTKKNCEARGTTIEAEAKSKLEEVYGPLGD